MSRTGELITERFDYDGGRAVTVYVPMRAPEAIVYAGDGQLIAPWGFDLERCDLPAVMVVGVHRTAVEDEMVRICEYSPGFEPRVFAAHEQFFVHDVRDWVQSRLGVALPSERTAVCGVSASGELALALGLRHPDVYGVVFSSSPGGGYRPPEVLPDVLPRAYLVAGTEEPWFAENAARWAEALRDGGAHVVSCERAGDHGGRFWREEFAQMVAWAFGDDEGVASRV